MNPVTVTGCVLLAFAVFAGVRSLFAWLGPVAARHVDRLDESHRTQLDDLFLPSENSRLYAVGEFIAPAAMTGLLLVLRPQSPIIAIAVGAAMFFVSRGIYAFLRRRRRTAFEQQLPDALTALASAVRAGLNLEQALELTATRFRGPAGQELGLVVKDIRLGAGVGQALERARRRVDMDVFSLVVTALSVAYERGGNLVQIVEQIEKSIREILRLEERVRVETASVRLSAKIMTATPIAFLIMFNFIDPQWNQVLFNTFIGNVILVLTAVMVAASYVMVNRLANPEL